MEFRVLGPLRAYDDGGTEIPLGGPKQRAVLALLLTSHGRSLEVDRLVDELWPDAADDRIRKTVQAYVSRLRAAFTAHGAPDAIRGRLTSYQLDPSITTDASRFEAALADATSRMDEEPAAAAKILRAALQAWRGRPYAETFPAPQIELEAGRLEERRLVAYETWATAELAAGRHAEALADLWRVAEENPLNERLWALLLLALYRSGRQSAALQLYVTVAERLAEELGVEPGPELADLQLRMLRHDPGLSSSEHPTSASDAGTRRPRHLTRTAMIATAALALVLAAAVLLLRPPGPPERKIAIGSRFTVPNGATQMVAAGESLWVLVPTDSAVVAITPTSGDVVRYELPEVPTAIAAGLGYVWIASADAHQVWEIDPATGQVLRATEPTPLGAAALAVGPDAVWVVRQESSSFLRIDPSSLAVEPLPFQDGFGGPAAPSLAVSSSELWATNAYIGQALVLDVASGAVHFVVDRRISEHKARSVLVNRGAVWISQPTNGSVTRIDQATLAVTTTRQLGASSGAGFGSIVTPYGLGAGPGGVWVALPDDHKVVILDDETADVIAEVTLARPLSVAATVGGVWVLDPGIGAVKELQVHACDPIPFIGPGADLRGCDLGQKSLLEIDLSGADLRWADLGFGIFDDANFSDADLYGANLAGASLRHVTWRHTRCPDGSLSDQRGGRC
jgi:DNA-binding SARP family transcriptional activator/DNA-binding beta-propeller fold protein YncE